MLGGRETLDLLDLEDLETILPFPCPPWTTPLGSVLNLHFTQREAVEAVNSQVKAEKARGAEVIFTDGSVMP